MEKNVNPFISIKKNNYETAFSLSLSPKRGIKLHVAKLILHKLFDLKTKELPLLVGKLIEKKNSI